MVNTLNHLQSNDESGQVQKYLGEINSIDPQKFEEPDHQQTVKEVILFIQESLHPNVSEPVPKLPVNMKIPRPVRVVPNPKLLPKRRKRRRNRRRKRKK